MQIFLHLLDGSQQIVDLDSETSIEQLLSCGGTRLVYQGAVLRSLSALGDLANVYVTGDLDGGKKKKKKKAFITKKKNKHIHKRIKLLPLSLYSVDGTPPLTQPKARSPTSASPAPPAAPAPSWRSTGTATTVGSATPPLRWTRRP
jgi:hypothetical protein